MNDKRWNDFWAKHRKKKVFVKMRSGHEFEGILREFKAAHGNLIVDVDVGHDGKPKHRFIRDDFSYVDIERSGKKYPKKDEKRVEKKNEPYLVVKK